MPDFLVPTTVRIGPGEWYTQTTGAEGCGQGIVRFTDKMTGANSGAVNRCYSNTCEVHGPAKARGHLGHAGRLLAGLDQVWVATVRNEFVLDSDGHERSLILERLRKRRERSPDSEYMWVYRLEGSAMHVFANRDLSGRKAPSRGEWISAQRAIFRIRRALRFPGVRRADYSTSWKPKRPYREPKSWTHGVVDTLVWDRALDLAADRIEERFGVRHNPPGRLPPGVPAEAWRAELIRAIDRARSERDENRD